MNSLASHDSCGALLLHRREHPGALTVDIVAQQAHAVADAYVESS